MDAAKALSDFKAWSLNVVTGYETNGTELSIVNDAADMDLGNITNKGWQTRTWDRHCRYLGSQKYHKVVDPGERLKVLKNKDACETWIQANYPGVCHNHQADSDALHAYYQMVYLNTQC